jgi:hypothetical protein
LRGAEVDRSLALAISAHGSGLARHATPQNCRPLFETPDRTYEIRLPESTIWHEGTPPPHRD